MQGNGMPRGTRNLQISEIQTIIPQLMFANVCIAVAELIAVIFQPSSPPEDSELQSMCL